MSKLFRVIVEKSYELMVVAQSEEEAIDVAKESVRLEPEACGEACFYNSKPVKTIEDVPSHLQETYPFGDQKVPNSTVAEMLEVTPH